MITTDKGKKHDNFAYIVDALVICDKYGKIVHFNRKAEQIFGRTSEETVGCDVSVLMPSPFKDVHATFIDNYFETGRKKLIGVTRQLKGIRKDGTIFPLEISLGELPEITSDGGRFLAVIRDVSKTVTNASRYENDFIELENLGRGGFGACYKVKNRLDGHVYAIKKVRLSKFISYGYDSYPDTSNDTSSEGLSSKDKAKLREASILATITSHPNVVRYYTSWIEAVMIEKLDPLLATNHNKDNQFQTYESTMEDTFDSTLNSKDEMMDSKRSEMMISKRSFVTNDFSMRSGDDSMDTISIKSETPREFTQPKGDIMTPKLSNISKSGNSDGSGEKSTGYSDISSDDIESKALVLYIQMEYCDGQNLQDHLNNPNRKVDYHENLIILSQIVKGLHHIHSSGYIHRDLKPSNIFLCKDGNVKIGDFGLAKQVETDQNDHFKSVGVGTALYAAPEQLISTNYDNKADCFAVGVILAEMFCPPFNSMLERYNALNEIRGRKLPPCIKKYPKICQIILRLLSLNPAERLSMKELLKDEILKEPMKEQSKRSQHNDETPHVQCPLCEQKNDLIAKLIIELSQKEDKIRNLERKIEKLKFDSKEAK